MTERPGHRQKAPDLGRGRDRGQQVEREHDPEREREPRRAPIGERKDEERERAEGIAFMHRRKQAERDEDGCRKAKRERPWRARPVTPVRTRSSRRRAPARTRSCAASVARRSRSDPTRTDHSASGLLDQPPQVPRPEGEDREDVALVGVETAGVGLEPPAARNGSQRTAMTRDTDDRGPDCSAPSHRGPGTMPRTARGRGAPGVSSSKRWRARPPPTGSAHAPRGRMPQPRPGRRSTRTGPTTR